MNAITSTSLDAMPMTTFTGHSLPIHKWPTKDRRAWEAVAQIGPADVLAEGDRPIWRPSSRELFARCYGGWLCWLMEAGHFDPKQSPADRVTKANLVAFLAARRHLGNSYRTLENYATSLRHIMRVLAPERDWRWMLPLIDNLKRAQPTKRVLGKLPTVFELFELGLALMKHAENDTERTIRDRAFNHRDGLMIAMLASRAFMRRANLASIKIGKHLVRTEEGYTLRFDQTEMKQKRTAEMFLPAMLTDKIDRYIRVYRPAILNGRPDPGGDLWISHNSPKLQDVAIKFQFSKITRQMFGVSVTPQKFRHCVATSIAMADPKNIGMVPTILAHASFAVSERFYIFAQEYAAYQKHSETLDLIKQQANESGAIGTSGKPLAVGHDGPAT
jgi:hypothetical protein